MRVSLRRVRLMSPAGAMDFPGPEPGEPTAEVRDDRMQMAMRPFVRPGA